MISRPRSTGTRLASAACGLVLLGGTLSAAPSASADPADPASPSPSACPTDGASGAAADGTDCEDSQEGQTADPSPSPTDDPSSTSSASPRLRQQSPTPQAAPQAAPATVVNGVTCTAANDKYHTPSTSNVSNGTFFNLPYGSYAQKNNLSHRVIRAINATPCGQVIRIAVYSLSDKRVVDGLINAYRRGVAVKVIVNKHMLVGSKKSSQALRLHRFLGQSTVKQSWMRSCTGSCRGTGGNHHYKMYLFSQAHNSVDVSMMGSHNSTTKAVNGQWNHLDVTGASDSFLNYVRIFNQAVINKPVPSPFRDYHDSTVETYFFPKPGTTASTDPMMIDTAGIRCTGAVSGWGRNGRSLVRVGMYAWHDSRGIWLAKRVRALWNAGCDVAIEYAIMGNTVKKILYSPAGRGRIPMRQVTTSSRSGTILNYLHDKYITFSGRQGSSSKVDWVFTGTTNWSNLGFASDDFTQVWHNRGRSRLYLSNFYGVWRGPKAHVPSPTSRLPSRIGTGSVKFGKGKYRNLENN